MSVCAPLGFGFCVLSSGFYIKCCVRIAIAASWAYEVTNHHIYLPTHPKWQYPPHLHHPTQFYTRNPTKPRRQWSPSPPSPLTPPSQKPKPKLKNPLQPAPPQPPPSRNLLQFLLAQVYLSRVNHIPHKHNLEHANWPTLHARPLWRQIIFVIRSSGTHDEYASHRPYYDNFLVEPAKALGVDRRDMKARVRAVPLGERHRVLVYWARISTAGIRMRL